MTGFLKVIGLLIVVLHCNGFSIRNNNDSDDNQPVFRLKSARRFEFPQGAVIIGAPSYPNHLPEAEPILPGHTLIRPGLGMLKSALKFPHREMEDGSGVYGNWDNLGIRYDGRNERVLYTGFRRSNSNSNPILLFLPLKSRSQKVKTEKDTQNVILNRIRDILNAERHRNWKSLFEKGYSSEEIKKNRQENERDKFLSFMIQKGLKINEPNQAAKNNLKSWISKDFFGTKDNYLDKLIQSIQRRFRFEDRSEDEKLDKKFLDQHKSIYKEFKVSDGKHDDNDFKEAGFSETENYSSSSEDINITHKANLAVTPNPNGKTLEERKREWFWQTKDSGNHIKINPNALDFKEFLPKLPGANDMEDIRGWWFFNQADHKNLQEKRRHG